MSIVRIGLGETQGYNDGYAAIFGKKGATAAKKPAAKKAPAKAQAKKPVAKKAAKKK